MVCSCSSIIIFYLKCSTENILLSSWQLSEDEKNAIDPSGGAAKTKRRRKKKKTEEEEVTSEAQAGENETAI